MVYYQKQSRFIAPLSFTPLRQVLVKMISRANARSLRTPTFYIPSIVNWYNATNQLPLQDYTTTNCSTQESSLSISNGLTSTLFASTSVALLVRLVAADITMMGK